MAEELKQLREEVNQVEEVEEESFLQPMLGLQPWQRLVLAVMLFLNVALCGLMALVAGGRVRLPGF